MNACMRANRKPAPFRSAAPIAFTRADTDYVIVDGPSADHVLHLYGGSALGPSTIVDPARFNSLDSGLGIMTSFYLHHIACPGCA